MENIRTCPNCLKENPNDLTVCQHCGSPLLALLPAPTTIQVPDQPPHTVRYAPPEHVSKLLGTYANTLVLVVVGQHDQPIILKDSRHATLGRYSPGDTAPTIDLTPYRADLMGVSRQHARITASEGGFRIEDLGSTNGTWVNEKKLGPHQFQELSSGTLLRLGQLGVYVYFRSGEASIADEILRLRNGSASISFSRLTAHYLTTYVIPYLNAVADLQAICNEYLERTPKEIGIRSISSDQDASITVKLEGAHEALALITGKLAGWRASQISPLVRLRGLPKDDPGAESLRRELAEAEIRLAAEFLVDIAPDRGGEVRSAYVKKLLPSLHVLTASALETVPAS